jgi:ABC-2 type transport system ATP-binding protein
MLNRNMHKAVVAENLCKSYQTNVRSHVALDRLNFQVDKGSVFAIRGVNGSGKSTLIRLLAGLLRPSSGSLRVHGDPANHYRLRNGIGLLLEGERTFYWRLSVMENLLFFAQINNLRTTEARSAIESWLEKFEIPHLRNERYETLSSGMRKKVAMVRSLLHAPQMILWDDPCTYLDARGIEILKQQIRELQKNNITLIIASPIHDAIIEVEDARLLLTPVGIQKDLQQ